jgi:Arc/MetJ family transcription regulator
MRTNIVIDDELMRRAMEVSGIGSKKEVVNTAITEFVARRTRRDLSELRGKIEFAEGYDYKSAREGCEK